MRTVFIKCNATSARIICVGGKNPKEKPTKVTIAPGQVKEVDDEFMKLARQKTVVQAWFDDGEFVEVRGESASVDGLDALAGSKAVVLREAGYKTVEDVAAASIEDLVQLQGIGEATATDLNERALESATAGGR